MSDWINKAQLLIRQEGQCALVTIADVKGSAPREVGTKMLVSANQTYGTIGGGRLEWVITTQCRNALRGHANHPTYVDIPLGPELGQCCGGNVRIVVDVLTTLDLPTLAASDQELARSNDVFLVYDLMRGNQTRRHICGRSWQSALPKLPTITGAPMASIGDVPLLRDGANSTTTYVERLKDRTLKLWLFGAGHVGKALVDSTKHLPFSITWIDSRKEVFPRSLPSNTRTLSSRSPAMMVASAPAAAAFLVMTHDHQQDYDICKQVLLRNDYTYLGLIGSATKRTRFEKRWHSQGLSQRMTQNLTCPIGLPNITGETPGEIAIATLAQLLTLQPAPVQSTTALAHRELAHVVPA